MYGNRNYLVLRLIGVKGSQRNYWLVNVFCRGHWYLILFWSARRRHRERETFVFFIFESEFDSGI